MVEFGFVARVLEFLPRLALEAVVPVATSASLSIIFARFDCLDGLA